MAFSIVTNIASLLAQDNLRLTSELQQKTIQRLTSGLRINSSADDAAGLAIANSFRSDVAVLQQGIRNANDGLSNLQTIDGGINNISLLLDRARSLATQSATGTFTGDRNVLNTEFSSVLGEIDRQAQAVGLDSGGLFAKALSVFIGGGRGHAGDATSVAIANGSVSVDLSNSVVDSKSLGLKGVQALGGTAGTTDIGSGSATTSVSQIVTNSTNTGSEAVAGFTDFYFRGPGFADANRVRVSANLSGVVDTTTLASAINAAIDAAGNASSASAAAFKAAGIKAVINTDSTGKQQLTFVSSNTAFQVEAGDRLANALIGNFSSGSTGTAVANTVTGGANVAAVGATFGATSNIIIRFEGSGLPGPVDITLSVTAATTTVGAALTALSNAISSNTTLSAAGITLTTATGGTPLVFTSNRGERFEVLAAGDTANKLGLGSFRLATASATSFDYTSVTGAAGTFAAAAETLEFSIGGGAKVALAVTPSAATEAGAIDALNTAFNGNATLHAAGLSASDSGGQILIQSTNGTAFRLNSVGATNVFGFNNTVDTGVAFTANAQSAITPKNTINSGGASDTELGTNKDVFTFAAIRNGGDNQTVTISATDSNGTAHSLAVVLQSNGTARNARSLDEAVDTINTALKQSNDSTLNRVITVKEQNFAGSAEGVRFLSTLPSFKVAISSNASTVGLSTDTSAQGVVVSSSTSSGGSISDVSTLANAQNAVSALAIAVVLLGAAQASVGKGQNQLQFAIGLASTQVNNTQAAQGRIRDADLAAEAANLTRASIAQQAGIAALAQANSAPQAVLALLRG
jgi:flagellin